MDLPFPQYHGSNSRKVFYMYYAIINQDVIICNFFSKSAHLQIDMESSMTGCHLYHFNWKNLFCHHEPVKRAGGQGTGFKHDFSVNKLI